GSCGDAGLQDATLYDATLYERQPFGLVQRTVVASYHVFQPSSSLQNPNVLSATASSEKYCIARALPACARGRRWSAAARRRSAAESASGSSPGTTSPASPITSGVAPALVPTTVTSCAIASATTCAAGSAHVATPRAGSTSTSSSGQSFGTSSGGRAPLQRTRAASRRSDASRSSRSRSGPSPTTVRCQRWARFSASACNKVSIPFSGTNRPTHPIARPS